MLAALGPAADAFFETQGRRPSLLLPPPSVFDTDTPIISITTPVLIIVIHDRARGHARRVRSGPDSVCETEGPLSAAATPYPPLCLVQTHSSLT